jgi:superfamily II DNA or RNA helicase
MPKGPKDPPSDAHTKVSKSGHGRSPSGPSQPSASCILPVLDEPVPRGTFDLHALPNGLASHQIEALLWAQQTPVAVLADATGSGKTAVAAALIGYAFDHEGAKRALWITEANLIPQAVRELRRFLPGLQVNRWPGKAGDQIRVVSVETLTRHVGTVVRFDADVAVVDDAAIKGEGAEPAAVAQVMRETTRRLCLNATPVELDATEAYRILRVLGAPDLPDPSVFESYMQWQDLPFGQQRPHATRVEAVAVVRSVFARFVLQRGPDELGLVLPKLCEETVLVALTAPQQVAYQQSGSAPTPMAVATKREKACSYVRGRSAKAEAAVRMLVLDPSVEKAVVYAEHLQHLTIAEGLLDAAGIAWVRIDGPCSPSKRAASLGAFKNDPKVRVLLATRVLERGLDGLQHCGVLMSLGASFNPAREAQRIGRLRRPGSPHATVRHITFVTDTGHERAKSATLRRRQQEAAALIHGLGTNHHSGEKQMELSEAQIHSLVSNRRYLPPLTAPYGAPLAEAVKDCEEMQYLQAAVRSGHVPDLDGIEFALDAYFVFVDDRLSSALDSGDHEEAEMWMDISGDYRKLASRLRAHADQLEAWDTKIRRRSV